MNSPVGTIIKVMAFSTAFSFAIKYGLPLLPIPTSSAIALSLVLLPPGILAVLLGVRSRAIAPTK